MSSNTTIQRLPIEVEPFKLVEQGRLFAGRIPHQDFSRLGDLLYSSNENEDNKLVEVDLEFTRTDTRLPVIKGQIKAELQMICNRCLDSTDLTIDTNFEVVLVSTDEQAERLQEGFDIWMVEDQKLLLQDFIEDEILLAMPIVISHEDCEPAKKLIEALPEDEEMEEQQEESPFAVLKDLKLN